MIPQGKFGFCVINVELNPEMVDVNVHPAKLEVRFVEESKIFTAVLHAIRGALLGHDLTLEPEKPQEIVQPQQEEEEKEEEKPSIKKGLFELFRGNQNKQ